MLSLAQTWRSIARDPLSGWFLFFFFIQIAFSMPMSTNPASRWVTMAALTEDGTPRTDAYKDATIDWSRTPDGHFYSNKAPGPALIALPLFAYLDAWQTWGVANRDDRDRVRFQNGSGTLRVLSILLQALPLFLLTLLLLRWIQAQGASFGARAVVGIGLLFGTTTSIFLNQYFGHGMTAVCALALYYAMLTSRVGWAVFFFSFGMLCEYSSALFLLPLLPWWIVGLRASDDKKRWVGLSVLGAVPPAVAWIAYHTYCFGGPLSIPNQFQNPIFVETVTDRWNLWGVLFLPSWNAVWGLTFGAARGILWTQPWVLLLLGSIVAIPALRSKLRDRQGYVAFTFPLICFALVFLMNASFGGWHGGGTAGPRYLSAGLILLVPVLGLAWDGRSLAWQCAAWALVGMTVCLQIIFMSVYLALPNQDVALWTFFLDQLTGPRSGTPILRWVLGIPLALWLLYRTGTAVFPRKSLSKNEALSSAAPH